MRAGQASDLLKTLGATSAERVVRNEYKAGPRFSLVKLSLKISRIPVRSTDARPR